MAKYAVRRISLGSTLKFGFILGLLLSLAPGLLCGLAGSWLVSTAYQIMAGWRDVRLELLGQPLRFDLIDLLNLGGLLENLRFLDQNDWLFALLLIVVACCVTALALGLSANLLTLGYNALAWLTGGLVIELRELDRGERLPTRPEAGGRVDTIGPHELMVEHIVRAPLSEGRSTDIERLPVSRGEERLLLEAAREEAQSGGAEETVTGM
jgi:hypothetical protein